MDRPLILILGATGQLGHELTLACEKKSAWRVRALSHDDFEITDHQALRRTMETHSPWAVMNCTAYNEVEAADSEPEKAFAINTAAVTHLANRCRSLGCLLVHVSTDYVFDGRATQPYTEHDEASPLNIYGLSKLAGEQAIRMVYDRHCIVRTCGLYGKHRSPRGKLNFVETILAKARRGDPLEVRDDLVCAPTAASDLAAVIVQLLEKEAVGTFHAANSGSCSWREFASEILKLQKIPRDLAPLSNIPRGVRRPAYTVLNTSPLAAHGISPMPAWQDALAAYLRNRQT